jgi:colanic acid/amylovoran biosynthesis protein
MGGLTDAFLGYAHMLLDTLELAADLGVPTALFGQGIGPLDDALTTRARQVLPKVNFIALREGRFGPSLLRACGVSEERMAVTGDDAIEMAFACRSPALGRAIGINLRTANYSGVDSETTLQLRGPIQSAARATGAALVPVPISRLPEESDLDAVKLLLGSHDDGTCADGGIDGGLHVFERIHDCRIVITGIYHAGVFALAQGVSVVGLAATPYYSWKFLGLAHQFGEGCRVVALHQPGAVRSLEHAVESAWADAERVRPGLLADFFESIRSRRGQAA